jgi:murein DD-endopeptidase MepM/ murein hydrolase activator NlpD
MAWPVEGYHTITSPYGNRTHPIHGGTRMHNGLDIGAPQGANIVAAESGVVSMASYYGGYGYTVIIEHGDNTRTLYAHIRSGGIKVSEGESVSRGQKIAEVGSTGSSTAPHLHFEVHKNGQPVNPAPYIR